MSSRNLYLPYVDGLRAIAVLAVLVYHLHAPWLPGGFAGVDVFFVISGFVVSLSVSRLPAMGLGSFLAFFYARRMRRIVPALLVCLLATSLAVSLLVPPAWLSDGITRTGLFAFFGLSNWVLARTQNDYFSPVAEMNPYTHTWSLGVEEQFYLAFPLLFFPWIAARGGRRVATGLFALALALSLAWAAWQSRADTTAGFYLVASRFWQLAAGVLLYLLLARGEGQHERAPGRMGNAVRAAGGWLSLGLVVYALVFSRPGQFSFPGALPVVAGTLGLLGFLYRQRPGDPLMRLLTQRPAVLLGKISYSLYLWHWPVFVLMRWTVGLDSGAQQVAAAAAALGLAVLSYRLVETPVRHWRSQRGAPGALVLYGVLAMAAGAAGARLMEAAQPRWSLSSVVRNAQDWYPHGQDSQPDLPGCQVQTQPHALSSGFMHRYARAGCDERGRSAPRVLAIGDSHATGYVPLFKEYVLRTGAEVYVYGNAGCSFLSLRPDLERPEHCQRGSQAAMADLLARLQPGDVVFLPSLRLPRFADQWGVFAPEAVHAVMFSESAAQARMQAVQAGRQVLQQFLDKGAQVVLEGPKPLFAAPTYRCAEPYQRHNALCAAGAQIDRNLLQEYRAPILDAYDEFKRISPKVSVWDPFAALCPASQAQCSAYEDGRPLFFDTDHLSGYGNRRLLPSFTAAMQGLRH